MTAGFRTVFRQREHLAEGSRILVITGSNVRVGDCTVEGNIDTDVGEQRHAVFVTANRETGDVSNIQIGNVIGVNIRGDVVYIGARDGKTITDVSIGNVHGSNILRNIVSVVGGERIAIGKITGNRVGFIHLDVEPDEGSGPVIGCSIESVRGGFVQVAGQSPNSFVDEVSIRVLNLKPPRERCSPVYPPGLELYDALEVRNLRRLEIGSLAISGFADAAIRQVWNPGALADQQIHIKEAVISDCARRRGRAYIVGSRMATHLAIDQLVVDVPRPGIDVVLDCKSARIWRVRGRLPKGSRLIAQSPDFTKPVLWGAGATVAGIAALAGRRWLTGYG